VGDRVEITGFVEADEYDDWLARATCLVQLRRRSHGESSGALVDAIAAGVPVITSVASAREFPAGVVDIVEPDAPVAVIASRLELLLADGDRRARMVDAGAEYARSWSARDAAAAVAGILTSTA
jgi:glycosyltransferase involved in cell wall biosynthesis